MQYDDFLSLVKQRRTIRRFMPDPVPDEFVDKIIEAARWAPSGMNQQPWEFVVVKKPELKNQIADLCRDSLTRSMKMEVGREEWQGKMNFGPPPANLKGGDFSVAPVYIVLFGDPRSKAGLPMSVRCEAAHLQSTFTSGLACCFLYMQLAATTLGLNSQWFTSVQTSYVHCLIKNILGIPQELEIYDMLVIGYPPEGSQIGPKAMRDKAEMVHYDRCGAQSFRDDEQVKAQIRKWRGL
jgi:nitroreductase